MLVTLEACVVCCTVWQLQLSCFLGNEFCSFLLHSKFVVMMVFWKSRFHISEFHVPDALFCSNINVVLQIVYELQS